MIKTFKTFASFVLITCMLSLRVSCFFARAETQFGSELSSMPGSGKLRSLSETVFGISCVCLLVLFSFFLVISLLAHTGTVVLGLVRFCARTVAGTAGFVAAVVCSVVDLLHRFVAAASCSVLDCVHSFFAPEGKEQVVASIVVPRRRFGREPRKGARIRFVPDESLVSACFIPHRSEIPQDEKMACYHSFKEIIEMAHFNYQDCRRSPAGRFFHKVKMAVLPVVCDERFLAFSAPVLLHCFFPSVEQDLYLKIASFVTSRSPKELAGWLILVSFLLVVAVCCLKMLVHFVPYLLIRTGTGVVVHAMARICFCFAERGCAFVRSLNASHVGAKDPTGDHDGEEEEEEEDTPMEMAPAEDNSSLNLPLQGAEEEEEKESQFEDQTMGAVTVIVPHLSEELKTVTPCRRTRTYLSRKCKEKVETISPCHRTRTYLSRKCKENVRYTQ